MHFVTVNAASMLFDQANDEYRGERTYVCRVSSHDSSLAMLSSTSTSIAGIDRSHPIGPSLDK